jgi:hypothetical protein
MRGFTVSNCGSREFNEVGGWCSIDDREFVVVDAIVVGSEWILLSFLPSLLTSSTAASTLPEIRCFACFS